MPDAERNARSASGDQKNQNKLHKESGCQILAWACSDKLPQSLVTEARDFSLQQVVLSIAADCL